jgi:hypothetical protein
MDIAAEIAGRVVGRRLLEVTHRESDDWLFQFSDGVRLEVAWSWRILAGGKLVFGADACRQQLLNRTIEHVDIREGIADIVMTFSGCVALEVLNLSDGFEGWKLGSGGLLVVAAGNGELFAFGL